ncbi:hypothetical protein RCL1_005872 [Eukaryota sp. TZLM3-RCL]
MFSSLLSKAKEKSKVLIDFYQDSLRDFTENLKDSIENPDTESEFPLEFHNELVPDIVPNDTSIIFQIQADISTWDPVSSAEFLAFSESFPLSNVLENQHKLLNSSPLLLKAFDDLVIRGELSERNFFLLYFYKLHSFNLDDRKVLLNSINLIDHEPDSCEDLFSDVNPCDSVIKTPTPSPSLPAKHDVDLESEEEAVDDLFS